MTEFHKALYESLFPKCLIRRWTLLGRHVKIRCFYTLEKELTTQMMKYSAFLQMLCMAIKITITHVYHGNVDGMRWFDPSRKFSLIEKLKRHYNLIYIYNHL